MVICKFFFQGECRFGDNCKFEHQFPSGNVPRTTNQTYQYNQNPTNQIFSTKPKNEIDTKALLQSVFKDMVSIEVSGQWLLTCYAPFKEKQLFPGFQDQSFEEIRLACYESQKQGVFEQYKQQLNQVLLDAKAKFKALKAPTKEIIAALKSIYDAPGSNTNSNPQNNSIFGGNQLSTNQQGSSSSSIFAQQSQTMVQPQPQQQQNNFNRMQQQTGGSIFVQPQQQNSNIFNNQVPNNSVQSVFTSTPSKPNIFNTPQNSFLNQNLFQANQTQQTAPSQNQSNSIFTQSIPQNQMNSFNMYNQAPQMEMKSVFSNTQNVPSTNAVMNPDFYSRIEDLSEDEIKWFSSNEVDINKVPSKPPTYDMCFN